ncbi:MAG: DUF1993 domain-containing protein, partial [Burkholderiaceae bacterium]
SAPVFARMLRNLEALLDKGAAYAAARKIDPAVLVNARLFPDMFPLSTQVRIAGDFAKGAVARLTGNEPPKYEDNEATFEDLKARIAKTVAYVESFKPEQFGDAATRTVTMKMRGEDKSFDGTTYLANIVLPNFYFHITTAYDILRHNGVELGKRDFTGPV